MGPALFTRASRLPRAVAARLQILAERRANRQRLWRSQFVLLVRPVRGSYRFQRLERRRVCRNTGLGPVRPAEMFSAAFGSAGYKPAGRTGWKPVFHVEFERESDILQQRRRMKMPKRLIDCLDENKISYEIIRHPEAVTAQRIAEAEHVKGRHHAKVVMLKSGGQHLMAVLPAEHLIDLEKLAKIVGQDVSFESEQEFQSLFPDCAVGAMPPFGNLYGVPTYVDKSLAEEDYIAFEAGTHTETIKVSYRDYEKIVKPQVKDLAIKIQPMKGMK